MLSMRDDPLSNIQFVTVIKKYPCLYNRTLPDYAKADNCQRAWEEIAEVMQETVETCKERWRNIRTVFLRSLKTRYTESGSRNKKPYYLSESLKFLLPFLRPSKPKPILEDMLENPSEIVFEELQDYAEEDNEDKESQKDVKLFINLNEQERSTSPDAEVFDEHMEFGSSLRADDEERPPKRTRLDNFGTNRNSARVLTLTSDCGTISQNEARKYFLFSLLPDIQRLNDEKMRIFRRRMLSLVDELNVDDNSSTKKEI